MEIWKPIKNFETHYEISTHGRVRSIDRTVNTGIKNNETKITKGKLLKFNEKKNGYLTVDLCIGNNHKTMSIHRLVALTFIPNPENKPYVNHKNANKKDNRIDNLEWVTAIENSNYASNLGLLYGGLRKGIKCVENGMIFTSSYKAAEWLNSEKFGFSKDVGAMSRKIRAVCTGKQKSAYGYRWIDLI